MLQRRVPHKRFRRIESLGPRAHVHVFRVTTRADLDHELRSWLEEAYAGFGQGRRVTPRPRA